MLLQASLLLAITSAVAGGKIDFIIKRNWNFTTLVTKYLSVRKQIDRFAVFVKRIPFWERNDHIYRWAQIGLDRPYCKSAFTKCSLPHTLRASLHHSRAPSTRVSVRGESIHAHECLLLDRTGSNDVSFRNILKLFYLEISLRSMLNNFETGSVQGWYRNCLLKCPFQLVRGWARVRPKGRKIVVSGGRRWERVSVWWDIVLYYFRIEWRSHRKENRRFQFTKYVKHNNVSPCYFQFKKAKIWKCRSLECVNNWIIFIALRNIKGLCKSESTDFCSSKRRRKHD